MYTSPPSCASPQLLIYDALHIFAVIMTNKTDVNVKLPFQGTCMCDCLPLHQWNSGDRQWVIYIITVD